MTEPDSPALELRCEFCRTSTDTREEKRLVLSAWPATVHDIKLHVQTHFSIPKCLQTLSHNGHSLEDSLSVSDLYIRSHDYLSLSYLCEADVEDTLEVVNSVLLPIVEGFETGLLDEEADDLFERCSTKLHDITFQKLLPWVDSRSEANCQLLIQEGGLRLIINILTHLLREPYSTRSDSKKQLETSIMAFFWNFSETRAARLAVIRSGGFALVLDSFLQSAQEQQYSFFNVFDQAVGVISK